MDILTAGAWDIGALESIDGATLLHSGFEDVSSVAA
jgi:hypothetical protein